MALKRFIVTRLTLKTEMFVTLAHDANQARQKIAATQREPVCSDEELIPPEHWTVNELPIDKSMVKDASALDDVADQFFSAV
jgi:hypothetical protein